MLALLALILLFAIFGWKALGILVFLILLGPILLVGAGFLLMWWLRRRMMHAARDVEQQLRRAAEQTSSPPSGARQNTIDVEGHLKE